LLCLGKQNPANFLDELLHLLKSNQFTSVHFTTILSNEHAGLSCKRPKWIAKERNKTLHACFIAPMDHHDPLKPRFSDETSKDVQTSVCAMDGRRKENGRENSKCSNFTGMRGWRTSQQGPSLRTSHAENGVGLVKGTPRDQGCCL